MEAALPEVSILDGARTAGLLQNPLFQGDATSDARNRRRYYVEAIVREQKRSESGGDYMRFLGSCEIRLDVLEYGPSDFERVADGGQAHPLPQDPEPPLGRETLRHAP